MSLEPSASRTTQNDESMNSNLCLGYNPFTAFDVDYELLREADHERIC